MPIIATDANLVLARALNKRVSVVIHDVDPGLALVTLLGRCLGSIRHDPAGGGLHPSEAERQSFARAVKHLVGFDPDAWLSGTGWPSPEPRQGGE